MNYTIFIAIITLFPVAVTLLLKGKYTSVVIPVAVLNLAAYTYSYHQFWLSGDESKQTRHLIVFTANIIGAVIIWYLAFKRQETVINAGSGLTTAAQLASANTHRNLLGNVLAGTGWMIVGAVLLIIAGFILALSAM